MIEKKLEKVDAQLFIADGDSDGNTQVLDASVFKVRQRVFIVSNTHQPMELEVKKISSQIDIKLGLIKDPIFKGHDISNYTISDGSTIFAEEQDRIAIPPDIYNRATYDEEPAVATRTIQVDALGRRQSSVVDSDGKLRMLVESMSGSNLIPHNYDDVQSEFDSNDNLTNVKFYFNNSKIGEIELAYDSSDNLIRVRKI